MLEVVDEISHLVVAQVQQAGSREFRGDPAEGDAERYQDPEIEQGSVEDRQPGTAGEIPGAEAQQADGEDEVDAGGQADEFADIDRADACLDRKKADNGGDDDTQDKQPGLLDSRPGALENRRDRHCAGKTQALQFDDLLSQGDDHHHPENGARGDGQRQGPVVDLLLAAHQEEDRDGEDHPRIDGVYR